MLEAAVRATIEAKVVLARKDFQEMLSLVRTCELSAASIKDLVRGKHLGEWKELFAQKVVKKEINDEENL